MPSVLPEASNKTVCVACKVPNGIFLQIWDMVDDDVPVMGGGVKTIKRAQSAGPKIFVRGPAAPKGVRLPNIFGGYALTPNVPLEFWERWKDQHADSMLVKNNMVFAHEKPRTAADWAKEHRSQKSNMEPLTPGTDAKGRNIDPRIPQLASKNLTAVDDATDEI
jgi:hypothetical protein